MTLSRNTIFFIVATTPIIFAAVQPWIWFFYTVCIFAAFFLVLLKKQERETWIKRKIIICILQQKRHTLGISSRNITYYPFHLKAVLGNLHHFLPISPLRKNE